LRIDVLNQGTYDTVLLLWSRCAIMLQSRMLFKIFILLASLFPIAALG